MIARISHYCKILCIVISLLSAQLLFAALPPIASAEPGETYPPLPVLPTITVEASRLDPLTGGSYLEQSQIKKLPTRNSNTSDLLRLMPGVQMPEAADSSKTAGEIAPAAVSIAGGRPYDNNFLIDGAGNNSLLDPRENNTDIINDVSGHPQEVFIHNDLIAEITLLRSNISARYGSFAGGVIDIKTIDPESSFQGKVSYRLSDAKWGKFHIDESQQEAFLNSTTASNQPKFLKQETSTTVHTPINTNSGFVFNYSLRHSRIPLKNFGSREIQYRLSENLFGKFKSSFETGLALSMSVLHAPYSGDYFIKSVKNSSYEEKGGGTTVVAKIENSGTSGTNETTLAYKKSFNSRRAPDNFLSWKNTASKNWGESTLSKEGGYGDIDKEQESLQFNLHHQFNNFRFARGLHRFAAGLDGQWTNAIYDRKKDMAIFSARADTNVDCGGDTSGCVDNEQYFFLKTIYPKDNAETDLFQAAAYVEDTLVIQRLTLRPGVRVSWDDYLRNTNIAPRLAAAYDLLGNGNTLLIAGANRYYGANLLTMSLALQKSPFNQYTRSLDVDNHPQEWTFLKEGSVSFDQRATLKTPYSDEWTVGFRQKLWGGVLQSDYQHRRGRDLLVTNRYDIDPDPIRAKYLKEWRNDGRSLHQEVNLSWQRSWTNQTLSLGATWQKTRSNSSSYTDSFIDSAEELGALIWYKGKVGTKEELLPEDYNRPFRASIIYTVKLLSKLSFTNTTIYRSPYKSAINSKQTRPYQGEDLDVYEDISNDAALIFDWQLAYEVFQRRNLDLALTVDIFNVFDHQTHLGGSETDYELGRQLWLGAVCHF